MHFVIGKAYVAVLCAIVILGIPELVHGQGFCTEQIHGNCIPCTISSDCPTGVCWAMVAGCGSDSGSTPAGSCAGGTPKCQPCTDEHQCKKPGGSCQASVPGCDASKPSPRPSPNSSPNSSPNPSPNPIYEEGNVWIDEKWKTNKNVFYRCRKPGQFALTFDDGPNEGTESLLNALAKSNVTATVFINGINVNEQSGKLLTRAEQEGHTVACHSYSHDNYIEKWGARLEEYITKEIDRNAETAKPYLQGGLKKYFRPPYLAANDALANRLASKGYKTVQINVETNDWKRLPAMNILQVFRNVLRPARPSKNTFISLQHDRNAGQIPSTIASIVKAIRNRGFELVTMEQCLG